MCLNNLLNFKLNEFTMQIKTKYPKLFIKINLLTISSLYYFNFQFITVFNN